MRKTQIQLEEEMYEAVRRRAYERKVSMAEVIREAVANDLGLSPEAPEPATLSFVGIGASANGRAVSESHDDELSRISDEES